MKYKDFFIHGKYFPTKAVLQNKIRTIRDSYADGESLSNDDFEFMSEVLEGHPEYKTKVGGGLKSMFVSTNPLYRNTRCFWLVRIDGSSTDFSFVECLTPTLHKKKFFRALRTAIEPITMEFKKQFFAKRTEPYYCPYTGEELHEIGSHVDHKAPNTFQELVEKFIREYAIDVDCIQIGGDVEDNTYQNTLVDDGLRQKWIDFHNAHAELQIISRTANLSITRTR